MKKFIVILAALLVATSLASCKSGEKNTEAQTNPNVTIPSGGDNTNTTTPNPTEADTSKPANERTFEEKNDTVVIMSPTGSANLRKDTNFSSSSAVNSLNNGTELQRTGVEDTWSRVKYEDKVYYIANSVIAEKDALNGFTDVKKTIKITADNLNVRVAPANTKGDPIVILKKDAEVEVVGFNNDLGASGWYKIKLEKSDKQPHEYGYISAHKDYSKVISDETPAEPEGNTGTTPEA